MSSRHGNLKCERDLKWPIKWKRDRKDCTTILNKSFWSLTLHLPIKYNKQREEEEEDPA